MCMSHLFQVAVIQAKTKMYVTQEQVKVLYNSVIYHQKCCIKAKQYVTMLYNMTQEQVRICLSVIYML